MAWAKVDMSSSGSFKRAVASRFVFWMLVLFLLEALVGAFESTILMPLLRALARIELASGTSQDLVGVVRSTLAVVFGSLFGAPSLNILSRSMVLTLGANMIVLVLAPPVVIAVLFASEVDALVRDELERRDDELRQAYERRNLMISDMAHDLRTPVMGISASAQAFADGLVKDPEEQERVLRSISAKADKMGELVSMLFDFVKLESEGFELDRKVLDLPQLLLAEAASAYTDIEAAGMELLVSVPEDPLPVYADEAQLRRAVGNLLANAQRHNPTGTRIELALGRRAGVADIIVADTGLAIEQDIEGLFEPFARGDASRSGGGSGLGLSIVKGILDMHDYTIELRQPYGSFTKAFVVTCAIGEG